MRVQWQNPTETFTKAFKLVTLTLLDTWYLLDLILPWSGPELVAFVSENTYNQLKTRCTNHMVPSILTVHGRPLVVCPCSMHSTYTTHTVVQSPFWPNLCHCDWPLMAVNKFHIHYVLDYTSMQYMFMNWVKNCRTLCIMTADCAQCTALDNQ